MDIPEKSTGQEGRRLILIFTLTISIAVGQPLNFSRPQFPPSEKRRHRLEDLEGFFYNLKAKGWVVVPDTQIVSLMSPRFATWPGPVEKWTRLLPPEARLAQGQQVCRQVCQLKVNVSGQARIRRRAPPFLAGASIKAPHGSSQRKWQRV